MCKKYVLILLIFSTHIFSMGDNEEKKLTERGIALIDKFREKPYAQLERELQQCKEVYSVLQENYRSTLSKIQDHLKVQKKCLSSQGNDPADKDQELAALNQRTTLLENQLTHAHSFEGWLSHRAMLPACASVMLLSWYKTFGMPRLHAWAQKIRKPTWKKRVLQLLACDWVQRRPFVRRRGRKKRNA